MTTFRRVVGEVTVRRHHDHDDTDTWTHDKHDHWDHHDDDYDRHDWDDCD
ncbi:hypothetical protein ACI79C_22280 [Geodermatophilus sp. SYSU D00697]